MNERQAYQERVREALKNSENGQARLSDLVDELVRDYAVPIPEALIAVIDAEGVRTDRMENFVALDLDQQCQPA